MDSRENVFKSSPNICAVGVIKTVANVATLALSLNGLNKKEYAAEDSIILSIRDLTNWALQIPQILLTRRRREPSQSETSEEGPTTGVYGIDFSPDKTDKKNRTLASGNLDNKVRIWNVDTGELVKVLDQHSESVYYVRYSPDGKTLAASSKDRTTIIWDTEKWNVMYTLRGHRAAVFNIRYSPDGTTLATASDDKTTRIWSVDSGECLHVLRGHTASIYDIYYSPCGTKLASCSLDNTTRIWSVLSGECLQILGNVSEEIVRSV